MVKWLNNDMALIVDYGTRRITIIVPGEATNGFATSTSGLRLGVDSLSENRR
jgi:hypothetical protein